MKTKKIKGVTNLAVTAVLLILSVSCSDFIEEEVLDATLIPDAYSTPGATEVALNGIIANWDESAVFRQNFLLVAGYRSDDNFLRNDTEPNRASLFTQDIIPINSLVTSIYETFYESVLNANLAVEGLENTTYEENDGLRLQHIAEARFYRAFAYFHLVRLYGDLILFTDPEETRDPDARTRVSKDLVYEQIIEDLTYAKEFLPPVAGSRLPEGPFKSTASAYLALAQLTIENWEEAARAADEVITGGEHMLLPNHADLFLQVNENSIEHIFSIRHDEARNNLAGAWFGSPNLTVGTGGVFRLPHTRDLRDSYSDNDLRIESTFLNQVWRRDETRAWIVDENGDRQLFPMDPRVVSEDSLATAKWWDFNVPSAEVRWQDFALMRYAEVLLIYAEAVNEGGTPGSLDKFEALNLVRRRAGLDDVTGLDVASFRDAVRLERRLELAFEGKRMYDLLRYGELVQALQQRSDDRGLGHNIPATRDLLPIPQTEIDLNPDAEQNPGY